MSIWICLIGFGRAAFKKGAIRGLPGRCHRLIVTGATGRLWPDNIAVAVKPPQAARDRSQNGARRSRSVPHIAHSEGARRLALSMRVKAYAKTELARVSGADFPRFAVFPRRSSQRLRTVQPTAMGIDRTCARRGWLRAKRGNPPKVYPKPVWYNLRTGRGSPEPVRRADALCPGLLTPHRADRGAPRVPGDLRSMTSGHDPARSGELRRARLLQN